MSTMIMNHASIAAAAGMSSSITSNPMVFQFPAHHYHPIGRRRRRYSSSSSSITSTSSISSFSLLIDNTLDLEEEEEEEEEAAAAAAQSPPNPESIYPPCRRLILLRHAHSSWPHPSLRDHDRPLSKSGEADAIKVSHRLRQLGYIPQLILSSDAVRTRETLKFMQEQVREFLEAEVHFIPSFYSVAAMDGQTAEHIQQAICKYSRDEIHTVMCMGHNRGWEEAASMLSGASVELKTCNAALLESIGKSWEEAFSLAGLGGWKLLGVVKPNSSL